MIANGNLFLDVPDADDNDTSLAFDSKYLNGSRHGGRRRRRRSRRRGSQIIVSRRVKVKWLSRGTIDAEEKVVLEAYDSRLCTLLNGLMVIYREGIDGLFVCLLLPTQRAAAREPFRHHN